MARRRWQNGCLFRRGKNWVLRYRQDEMAGDGAIRRVHRSVVLGHSTTKFEAQRAAEAHLRQTNNGTPPPRIQITLDDFWSRHFEPDILPMLKPNTRRLYTGIFTRHIKSMLGGMPLGDIGRPHIQQLVAAKQREGYAPQTVAHVRNTLGKIFSVAIDWGWLESNPAHGVHLPPMRRTRQPLVLSTVQVKQIFDALAEPARTLFLLGVLTGLRIGELLGLRVEDFDFATTTMHVRRTVCRGEVGTPKTAGSERSIPLPESVITLLRGYTKGKVGWLFPTSVGTPCDDRTLFNRQVKPVCEALKVHFTWHSMRHTFSTLQGNQGAPLPVLQALLGHTTARVTMGYTHPLEQSKREAMGKLASILFPIVPTPGAIGDKEKAYVQ